MQRFQFKSERVPGSGRSVRLLWILYTLAVAVVITWFSSQTGDDSAEVSYGLAERIQPALGLDASVWYYLYYLNMAIRKIAHFGIFSALGFGLYGSLSYQERFRKLWAAVVLGAVFAALDEIHQSFVPGRVAKAHDVVIDTLGVLAGAAAARLALRWQEKRKAAREQTRSTE